MKRIITLLMILSCITTTYNSMATTWNMPSISLDTEPGFHPIIDKNDNKQETKDHNDTVKEKVKKYRNKEAHNHPLNNKKYENDFYTQAWNRKKTEIIDSIEKNGLDAIDKPEYDEIGYTPLCRAIEGNDFGFVKFLLQNGANPNKRIYNVHSSHPIFFAKTLEMVKFLQENGADIYKRNEGTGITGGMDFLHASIQCNTQDERLITHALKHKFYAHHNTLNRTGGNLWHSLLSVSAGYYPEEKLMARAALLRELGIDPHHKNYRGVSAIDMIKNEIETEDKFLSTQNATDLHIKSRIEARNKLHRVYNFMEETAQAKQTPQQDQPVDAKIQQ